MTRCASDTSGLRSARGWKGLALAALIACALVGVALVISSLVSPYAKDLRQGYLLAQAMAHGLDPYLPLPELGREFLPGHSMDDMAHPSPHPFVVGWLSLPLALFTYEHAAVVWLLFELVCLAVSVVLFLRILRVPASGWQTLAITFLAIGWWPVANELRWGQLTLLVVALFLGAWLALRQGRDIAGGFLLGGLALVKLAGWPIVLWLLLQRRWKAVWTTGLVFSLLHGLAIALYGWPLVRDYYLKVGPQVSAIYRVWEMNFSAWTIGQRLFADSGDRFLSTPLWRSPLLASVVTIALPLLIVGLGVRAAQRLRSFDASFALLMALGVILNPVAWQHYLVMAAPALVLLVMRLRALQWPPRTTVVVALLLLTISVPYYWFRVLALHFAVGVSPAGKPIVPALPALLTLTTGVALCGLLWLLVKLEPKMSGLSRPSAAASRPVVPDASHSVAR
jgi:alpha-1,2-mannosyltransferase